LNLQIAPYKTGNQLIAILLIGILSGNFYILQAQLRVPFKNRTSQYTPEKKIYTLKGDFTMIGNTNLTLQNYSGVDNNNYNLMQYVDVDSDADTWNSSSADLVFSTENNAVPSCSNIVYAGLYWTGRSACDSSTDSPDSFSVTKIVNGSLVTKTFNKRKIYLRGPGSDSYSEITAAPDAVYYPKTTDAYIYSAYAEVTDYVRQHGVGTYFAGDMALVEGNGEGTGYSGGWGLVVVYGNSKMKRRDISLFDGHAFVLSANTSGFNLEVSGFNTVPSGAVGAKLGVMASEGDVAITGDYFKIQKNSDLSFMSLSHSGNTIDNFFNSSINTGGNNRNPNLQNNTGIDISVFELPNTYNSIIGNNQTSTNFSYGTNGDTYAIFAMALAVDSYIPEVEGKITATTINQQAIQSAPYTTLPGQEIGFNVDVKNLSNEAVNGYKIIVPIPYNATYVPGSAIGNVLFTSPVPMPNTVYFDATKGATGSIIWDFGNLPLPANPNTILGKLNFRLKATENCAILSNADCGNSISVSGFAGGVGASSNVRFSNIRFIQGYKPNGNCAGESIETPILISINASAYAGSSCQGQSAIQNFTFCNTNNTVSIAEIATHFPNGCKFYNAFPVIENTIQYSATASFPLNAASQTFYAIPPDGSESCKFAFTLSKCLTITANNDTGTTVNNISGGITFTNVLQNDTLNDAAVTSTQVALSFVSATHSGITFSGNNVIVAPGTPAGNYTLTYQICSISDPSKCSQATVSINVTAISIDAQNNTYGFACSTTGTIGNVLSNDTFNGTQCSAGNVSVTLLSSESPHIQINNSGEIVAVHGISPGQYHVQYQINSISDPGVNAVADVLINITDTMPPPVPVLDKLAGPCSVTAPIPVAIDKCSGLVKGVTSDPLYYNIPGTYSIHWQFTDSSGNSSEADQEIEVLSPQNAAPVHAYADCNSDNDISVNIDLNTLLPAGTPLDGNWTDIDNSHNLTGSVFSPYQVPVGSYKFHYSVTTGDCSGLIEAEIEVDDDCIVKSACTLLVHNAFSPNDDQNNDVFVIENIDQMFCFPTNNISIFNRWGVVVYETRQYDNTTRVFRGISEGRVTVDESSKLPTGTYFYILEYTDTKANALKKEGYLYLTR
jgi:gliding motility-associated-like protein